MLNIVKTVPYNTWSEFSDKIDETFKIIGDLEIVNKICKLSLRYVNFFESVKILNESNLSVSLKHESLTSNNVNIEAQILNPESTSFLKILTNAGVQIKNEQKNGSVVDIETGLNKIDQNLTCYNLKQFADILHNDTKTLFYKFLSDKYIDSLEVTY